MAPQLWSAVGRARRTVATALAALLALSTAAAPTTVLPPSLRPAPAFAAVSVGYVSQGRAPVAPGVAHDWGTFETTRSGPQAVHLVEVDLGTPGIGVEAALAGDRITSLERTSSLARRLSTEGHRAVAAVNGDVFGGYGSPTMFAPNGLHVQAGELVTAPRLARPAFGIDASGLPLLGTVLVTMSATLPDGSVRAIDRVNQARTGAQVALYTSRFGPATPADASGTDLVLAGVALPLAPTGLHQAVVMEVRPATGGIPIAAGTVVLNGPAGSWLDALVPGGSLTLSLAITPGWEGVREAIGGREVIVRDGVVEVSPRSAVSGELHPRTALGITAAGDLVLATVDGRQPGYSGGVDLDEMGQLLVARGAVQAIGLDGGGSTTMAVRLPGDVEASVANRPAAGQELAVANALLIVSSVPTGPLALLDVVPGAAELGPGEAATFVAKGRDAAYNGVALDPAEVTWAAQGVGTIDAAGRYAAPAGAGPGTATVSATARGLVAVATVTVRPGPVPPVVPPPPVLPRLEIGAASALGLAPAGAYTTKSPKVAAVGRWVTWRFSGGADLAGQRVNILVATRVDGAWGRPAYLRSAWADAAGTVTFAWRLRSPGAVNVRVQWPGDPGHGVSVSPALGAYWR